MTLGLIGCVALVLFGGRRTDDSHARQPAAAANQAAAPVTAADLVLRAAELPAGATVTGGVPDGDSGFVRSFDMTGSPLGGSRPTKLTSSAHLYPNERLAGAAFRDARANAATELERRLRNGAHGTANTIPIERHAIPANRLGQDAFGLDVVWDRGDGRMRSVLVMVRVGRATSLVIVDGSAAGFDPADTYPVVAGMRERLRTGLRI